MKYSVLKEQIKLDLKAGNVPFIEGPPGCGKSALAKDVADEDEYRLIPLILSVMDVTDLNGFPRIGKDSARFIPVKPIADIFNTDEKILVCLDDFGMAMDPLQKGVMQLIHGGQLNGHTVGKNVRFILCSNRTTDRAGVNRIITPIWGRIVTRQFDFDLDDWVTWALKNDLDIKVIAFSRFRPGCFSDFETMGKEYKTFCSCRAMEFMSKSEKGGIVSGCEMEVCSGNMGERYGAEYVGFRKIFTKLPNPDVVIMQPEKIDIPVDIATLFALCGAVARKCTENNIDRIITFANRLDTEFSVLLVKDCLRVCPAIASTRPFIEWCSKTGSDIL
jgi:hypothetical protein